MNSDVSKNAVMAAINKIIGVFDIEFGPQTNYNNNSTDCEFAGCDRQAFYFIQSPNYDRNYNSVYGFACAIHVGAETLKLAAKFVDKSFDNQYCKVCEASAFACDCEEIQALGSDIIPMGATVERKTYICNICRCDVSEHNWEIHHAEMKAESNY